MAVDGTMATMHRKEDEEKGRSLLTAVERLVTSNEAIRQRVAECEARAKATEAGAKNRQTQRDFAAQELIRSYSNRAAIAGGAAAAPALIPGVGSFAAVVAGSFAELAYLLKCEVEMSLALSHLYGFDIDEPKERQLAFLMASVGTYDAGGKNFFADVARAEGVAVWNYGPRRLAGFVLTAMTGVALTWVWRGFFKAVPVLGIVIGTSMNKVLTKRVGDRVMTDLRTRRELFATEHKQARAAARKPAATPKAAVKPKAAAKPKPRPKPRLKVVEGD